MRFSRPINMDYNQGVRQNGAKSLLFLGFYISAERARPAIRFRRNCNVVRFGWDIAKFGLKISSFMTANWRIASEAGSIFQRGFGQERCWFHERDRQGETLWQKANCLPTSSSHNRGSSPLHLIEH
ncbi:hypothetical protein NFI96_014522 [Prochilodus magdalenae]|nr:hypothetical protein NFI96_014522 [Prochilodus magdalenae]